MISVFKWAWQAKPDTPAEKLVLVSLANSTFQTPREDIAVVGVRALRGTACDRRRRNSTRSWNVWKSRVSSRRSRPTANRSNGI